MNRQKVLAVFFGCLCIGALNEAFLIFRDPVHVGKWKAKAISTVAAGIFAVVATYFWKKSAK